MATNSYSKLFRAIRSSELAEAHELFKDIMQQKVATRLAEEKQHLMEDANAGARIAHCALSTCPAKGRDMNVYAANPKCGYCKYDMKIGSAKLQEDVKCADCGGELGKDWTNVDTTDGKKQSICKKCAAKPDED